MADDAAAAAAAEFSGGGGTHPEWEVLSEGGCKWLSQLGHGQYGTVHLVYTTEAPGQEGDGNAVAKVVFLDHLKDRDRALAQQEVEVLRKLQHPNIVRHYSSWLHRGSSASGAGKQEALVTLMEYCAGGDLRQCLDEYARRQEYLAEGLVLSLFVQMLEAMRYVHSHKILHRDLKTSNMLLTADRQTVKVGDFGIARVLENTAAVAVTMLGTPYYMSPEVCKGEPYREKSDIWSLGCVLYEMCVLRHAFESQSLLGLVYCIVSECYEPIPEERYSAPVAELVARLLVKAADERPSAEDSLASAVLRPYLGGGAPAASPLAASTASASVPPPPPPPIRALGAPGGPGFPGGAGPGGGPGGGLGGDDGAPLPPPSPGRSGCWEDTGEAVGVLLPPGTPSGSPPHSIGDETQELTGGSYLAMPSIRRPAPPPPGGSPGGLRGRGISPQPGAGGGAGGFGTGSEPTERVRSPMRRTFAELQASSRPAAAWAETSVEVQILLAKARRALLRRSKSQGNWVLAFARHDTTGAGVLGPEQFAGFLASLDLGLSPGEVEDVATGLAATAGGSIALGTFSEAITHATPSDQRWSEPWALEAARALAAAAGSLASLTGRTEEQALAAAPPLPPLGPEGPATVDEAAAKFLLWLPKTAAGPVDWFAAEEWQRGS